MNVDMITTVLNDFSTFWSNIWKFLKPIFGLAQEEGWEKGEHLKNLNLINKIFGGGEYGPAGSSAGETTPDAGAN